MGAHDRSPGLEERFTDEGAPRAGTENPLPDLLELDLDELRTIQHPVLQDVLVDLRERAVRPSEMLWGFTSAL